MEPKLDELKQRLAEVFDLRAASSVLEWDQETYMPPGGNRARAQQLATLETVAHEKFTSDEIGKLLEELKDYEASLPFDSNEASLIRVARRDYERDRRLPAEFVARLTENGSLSYHAWAAARPNSDFAVVQPWLERTLDLSREYAGYYPGYAHPIDPLIDQTDAGMTAETIGRFFGDLRAELLPLVQAITAQPPADDACLRRSFPEAEQWAFGEEVVSCLGYDFTRGRQDRTAHPFTIRFDVDDVRITTRVEPEYLGEALFSTIHEAGHAMYEQGVDHALARSLLARGASSGAHESQSRLWENIVGRSRGFWQYFYPRLQVRFPEQLGSVPLDAFYRAINKVERSLIRTDADEVTYNLHVMMRFDFERQMLEGKLAIRDLPEAWNARMQQDLGVTPPNYAKGVMQDVHWYGGVIGGVFQGYTLGNILSAQFFESAIRAHPSIPDDIARGEFGALRGWLVEHVYRHGKKFLTPDLVRRATGQEITIGPYVSYLRNKYQELYSI